MKKRKSSSQASANGDERMLELLKDLFIIQGRTAGMSIKDLRIILKVKKNRITSITKRMKSVGKEG